VRTTFTPISMDMVKTINILSLNVVREMKNYSEVSDKKGKKSEKSS
jgi:hypothetical protein